VSVTIYDIAGTPVRTISVGYLQAGSYVSQSRAIYWDGRLILVKESLVAYIFIKYRREITQKPARW
jgi:hypothetical protein